jgi:hypothetical protein
MRLLGKNSADLPWYGWILAPLVLPGALLVMLLLAIPAAISIPYFLLFPERHRQIHDFDGTTHQQARLARWRAVSSQLDFFSRVARAFKRGQRRVHTKRLTNRCS